MSASRDARAEIYTDVSAIIGHMVCIECGGSAVQRVVDVCSSTYHIGETEGKVVASFPGSHLRDAFAIPRAPEVPMNREAWKWFSAAAAALPVMVVLILWNRTAGTVSSALPIVCLAIGGIDFKRERYARMTFRSALAWHDEELRFWHSLYYCHACGQVFAPKGPRSVAPDQWRRLMV